MRFHQVKMNITMILSVSIMAIFTIGTISMVPVALAYSGLGADGGITLEEIETALTLIDSTDLIEEALPKETSISSAFLNLS